MSRQIVIKAVREMQEYMQKNVKQPISLHDLARISGYSPWYCSRIFKELTGKTPFEYLRALRITHAAMELRNGTEKVIDVAFDFVFDTHEGFSRAFSRQFGISPWEYKKTTPPVKYFLPYPVQASIQNHFKGEKKMPEQKKETNGVEHFIFTQVVEKPARKLILKRGCKAKEYFEFCEETGCDVWGILVSIKEALYEPMGMWLPSRMITPGTSQYVQGVEVPLSYDGIVPDGFDCVELQAAKFMVFQGEPFDDDEFGPAIGALQKAIKQFNPKLYGFQWADHMAPAFQLEPQGYRGYIEGRPVQAMK